MSKSKPYSSMSVKSVDAGVLAAEHRGQACVLGIDVAKFELMGVLRWPDGTFGRPWRIANPGEVGLLVEKLDALRSSCPVTVSMESSGTYGDAVRQALGDARVVVHRVSAKAVKDQAETFDGVPSQHDGKDAAIIADLCGRGKGKPWAMESGDESDREIRYWVRRVDAAQRVKQMWGGKIEALLARHWPEATRLMPASSATLSKALRRWGSPAALAADVDAAARLQSFGGHYLSEAKIAAIVASAKASGGVRMNAWEAREVQELAGEVCARRKEIGDCKRRLRALTRDHETIQAQKPAVGLVAACVLWTCLGDPRDYGSAAAYRKAMGLNLVERSSGRFKGQLRISKRGQRLTRKWMYFGALRWMRDAAVKRWTIPKKARDGGKGSRAMVAVMRRLALAAWHVAVNGEEFDAGRLFPGVAGQRPAKVQDKAATMQAAGG
ncbi:MAG TPA: transposase [Tepidisphaeraceae bacterium]|nr:transposase [Tepidisphaeraceae bacterium]